MKVKVKKCSKPEWWYNKKIGQEFNVIDCIDNDYIVKSGLYNGVISKEDCEVIPDVVMDHENTGAKPSSVKTIKMSLDTARKLYESSPETVKNWLLENFTKEELEPKKGFTWEESFDGRGVFISPDSYLISTDTDKKTSQFKNIFKTFEQAESALAFAQLTHIVAKYNEGKEFKGECFVPAVKKGWLHYVKSDDPHYIKCGIAFIDEKDADISLDVNNNLWKQYWMIK